MSDPVVLDDSMQVDDISTINGAGTVDESVLEEGDDADVTNDHEQEEDEEIDELADDDELDDTSAPAVAAAAPSAPSASSSVAAAGGSAPLPATKPAAPKKAPRKPASERNPGSSLLPVTRVTKVMKADKELGITAKEAVFLVSVATEEFIKRLGIEGHKQAVREGRSVINQKDLATGVKRADELLFLKEIIPLPVSLSQAMSKRQAKADGADIDGPVSTTNNGIFPRPTQNIAAAGANLNSNSTTPVVGALDAFVDRKALPKRTRLSRSSAAAGGPSNNAHNAPEGLVNGQHTFSIVDPDVLERERHPSYYGDFATPISPSVSAGTSGLGISPTPIPTAASAAAASPTSAPPPRSSGRLSIPSARRAAASEDTMDTT